MSVIRVDQGMAAAASKALPATVDKELRTRYRQLRVMLHTAGLAATYAFIASKAGDGSDASGGLPAAYGKAAARIREQLGEAGLLPGDPVAMSAREVMCELGRMDPVHYARASAEAAAFIGWLSRLADAAWQAGDEGA